MYLGVQFVVSLIYGIVAVIVIGFKIGLESFASGDFLLGDNLSELILSNINLWIPVVISVVITVGILFLILRKEWKTERLWNFSQIKIPPALLCLALGAALNILTICVLGFLQVSQEPSALDDLVGNNLIAEFMIIAVLVPILEEIIFRGIVQRRLSKMMSRHIAIFLQALIFGIIHLNLLQGIYAFFLGVIIGYVYHWFDSIWIAIAIHGAFNGTNVLLFYIFGDSEINLIYFLFIALIVFIATMTSLAVLSERQKLKAYSNNISGNNNYNRWYF